MVKTDELNYVERNHLDIVNKIYYTYLSNIKLTILNNKFIRETGYEMFESEWKNYRKDLLITVNDVISKPFLIIPFNLEDVIEGKICNFIYHF